MTEREKELRQLYDHLQFGDAKVVSYTNNGLKWSAVLYGDGEYITCESFGRYSIKNRIRDFRWLLWNMLNIHSRIEWSPVR